MTLISSVSNTSKAHRVSFTAFPKISAQRRSPCWAAPCHLPLLLSWQDRLASNLRIAGTRSAVGFTSWSTSVSGQRIESSFGWPLWWPACCNGSQSGKRTTIMSRKHWFAWLAFYSVSTCFSVVCAKLVVRKPSPHSLASSWMTLWEESESFPIGWPLVS